MMIKVFNKRISLMKLKRPTLLLDRQKCLANVRLMAEKAQRHGVIFRPHFKTHQSAEIGKWFRSFGVEKIAVSSVTMAQYFAASEWKDITIAFPVNLNEIDEINALSEAIVLNVLIENEEGVQALAEQIRHTVGIFIKIDAGYHRTGVEVDNHEKVLSLIQLLSMTKNLDFKGLILHNGNTYYQTDPKSILEIHNQSIRQLAELKAFLIGHDHHPLISIGDTPAMSLTENLEHVDEIRPGNFVFYDLMQQTLGACTYDDIAVAMACPVVAVHPERLEVVIYGGAIHLSKDFLHDENGRMVFGKVVLLNETGWSDPIEQTVIKSLSQEHGVIKTTAEKIGLFYPGQFIGILPVHSCLTTNLADHLLTLDGEKIETMRRFQASRTIQGSINL
jgi:D-serine deaminase-like pyridoxal phosphate-dependent protein